MFLARLSQYLYYLHEDNRLVTNKSNFLPNFRNKIILLNITGTHIYIIGCKNTFPL